jgi:hypothetical protein
LARLGVWGLLPALAVVCVGLVLWYLLAQNHQGILVVGTVGAIVGAAWTGLRDVLAKHEERIRTALRYVERFNDPNMMQVKVAAEKFWREYLQSGVQLNNVLDYVRGGNPNFESGRRSKKSHSPDEFLRGLWSVYTYLNFLEELAMAYRRAYIERQVVRQYFEDILAQADSSYRAFLEGYRTVRSGSYPHLLLLTEELMREDANIT